VLNKEIASSFALHNVSTVVGLTVWHK